jgi:hypothetical protein
LLESAVASPEARYPATNSPLCSPRRRYSNTRCNVTIARASTACSNRGDPSLRIASMQVSVIAVCAGVAT